MARSAIALLSLVSVVGVLAVWSVPTLTGEERTTETASPPHLSVSPTSPRLIQGNKSLRARFLEVMKKRAATMSDDEVRQAIEKESRAVVEADAQNNVEQAIKMVRNAMLLLAEVAEVYPKTRAAQHAQRIETVLRHAVSGNEILIRGQRPATGPGHTHAHAPQDPSHRPSHAIP